ncbi:MAG: hypothetical protein J7K34_00200 [Flavobacteriaceae bacterium]|nr:hypothetical protein [Flavobacteriaceae bacterium]
MKNIHKDLRLIPYSFKKLIYAAFGLIVLVGVLSITKVLPFDKGLVKTFFQSVLLIIFLLFALTEDKVEDELISKIRLKSFVASFIYGVVTLVIDPLINLIFEGEFYSDKSANELLISMFLFYFLIFYFIKKKR